LRQELFTLRETKIGSRSQLADQKVQRQKGLYIALATRYNSWSKRWRKPKESTDAGKLWIDSEESLNRGKRGRL
jgi:hypothetical protein